MSLGAAIGYYDAMAGGSFVTSQLDTTPADPSAGSPWITGTQIGSINNLFTAQLSQCFGLADGHGAMYFYRRFATPITLGMVSFLDLRTDGEVLITAQAWSDTTGIDLASPSTDYMANPGSGFIWNHHLFASTPLENCHTVLIRVQGKLISGVRKRFTLGRIWAGPVYRPPNGICKEWESTLIDPGEVGKSRGGQGYPRYRQKYRRVRMDLSHITFEQCFGGPSYTDMDLQQLGFRLGTTEPCLVFPRTTDATGAADTQAIHRIGIYGHLTELPNIRHRAGNYFDASLTAEELL